MSFCKARVEGNVQLAYNKTLLTFLVNSRLLIRNSLQSFSLLRKLVHLYTKLISLYEKTLKKFAIRAEILEKSTRFKILIYILLIFVPIILTSSENLVAIFKKRIQLQCLTLRLLISTISS